jgi:hypothetical protein
MVTKQTGAVGFSFGMVLWPGQPSAGGVPRAWKSVTFGSLALKRQLILKFSASGHPNRLGVIWSSLTGN